MTETSEPVRRLLSGIRPSGALHLGHYVGALRQWLAYQDAYECFCLLADVQDLAVRRAAAVDRSLSVRDVMLDWLAVGLRPERCVFVLQSRVPALAELTVYLQALVKTGELRDNPTSREEARAWGKGSFSDAVDDVDFGFLGYPVAQAADILLFSPSPPRDGDRMIVPVGFDQVPHVEFAAGLARRFNEVYAPVFLEPEVRTDDVSRLPGIDGGSKMGKSLSNAIYLRDDEAASTAKVRAMFTDPLREHAGDPGHPDDCPCFLYRAAFGQRDLAERCEDCKRGLTDCGDCKEELAREIRAFLDPIQARRREYERAPDRISDILAEGARRARSIADETIGRVREAMGLTYPSLMREAF